MSRNILELRELSVDYHMPSGDIHAVRKASLNVSEGQIFGIIGESGSGKSTLGYAIPRLLPPYAIVRGGEIIIDGRDIVTLPESQLNEIRGKVLTYVPQGAQNALNPVFTVEHQIADPIREHTHMSWKEAVRRARESLESVGVRRNRANQYPHQFSGGMKQRALIALALALNSKLVILDEPTTALDVLVQRQVFDLVKEIRSKFGTSFLLISHDLAIVSTVCDMIAIMYAGEIVEMAPTREIFGNPRHPYTRALISSLPKLNFADQDLEQIRGSPPNLSRLPTGCAFHPRCKYAVEKCTQVSPLLEDLDPNHAVACHRVKELEKWKRQ
ncbi:MAG: ABC transporter ATP-binding protein [Thaumarchaeota archaeon]|nr:ABC transporter ATP-binding protein [Nitrososphaerota archaeon]